MLGPFDHIEVESKCPECGHKVTFIFGPAGVPITCKGCSFVIDSEEFIEISHQLHDVLQKTMLSLSNREDE